MSQPVHVAGVHQTPLSDALENIIDYFEDRADASCEPGDDRFRGNKEMSLLADAEEVQLGVARLLAQLADAKQAISEASSFTLEQRNADTLDAERYRFLRNGAALEECGPSVCSGCSDLFEYHWGAEVDEVVDEAMARWKAAGSPVPKVTPA
jgi:hypothetical protein